MGWEGAPAAPAPGPPHLSVSAVLKIALPNPLHAVILFFNTSRENRSFFSRTRGEDPERAAEDFVLARLSVTFCPSESLLCIRYFFHKTDGKVKA